MASSAPKPEPESSSISDPFKILDITLNSDGSLTRHTVYPSSPATPHLTGDSQLTALSKDIPLNTKNATFLRLYRPVSPPTQKLPIIIYFHPGGFILVNANTTPVHLTCSEISAQSPAIVISVEYRLAPEHRLPAAYDDGVDAILWLRDQASKSKNIHGCDEWLNECGDFSKVYLMGASAGGNLVYNAGLRGLDLDLSPLTILGFIFDQPFLGGVERTKAELRLVNDHVLPLDVADFMWSLALPLGSDRDHEYCNLLEGRNRPTIEKIKRLPKCLIRTHDGDPMVDRQKEFANMLDAHSVHVTRKFYEGGHHMVEVLDPNKAQILYDEIKSFVLT